MLPGGAWQTPPVQMLLAQSALTLHVRPVLQSEHVGPPQSTSVSPPFFTPSAQVGTGGVPPPGPSAQSSVLWALTSIVFALNVPRNSVPEPTPNETRAFGASNAPSNGASMRSVVVPA